MNATELYKKDGSAAGIYFCAECRLVRRTEVEANECCAPKYCGCGRELEGGYWLTCKACQLKKSEEVERARFENAEKITEWDGWIYCENIGYNEGYFSGVDALEEYISEQSPSPEEYASMTESERVEILKLPAYVWTCQSSAFACLSIDQMKYAIQESDEAFEDFDADDLKGWEELDKAVTAFNAANAEVVSYHPDYKVALLLSKSNAECSPG